MIKNAEQVLSHFGYWPEFCDAKIASFAYRRTGIIELALDYIDLNLAKSADVLIQFCGTSEVVVNDLLSENVVDEISFDGTGPYAVTIESCYGLCGQFKCNSIEVVSFEPKNYVATDEY